MMTEGEPSAEPSARPKRTTAALWRIVTWGRAESREKPQVRPLSARPFGVLATVSADNCDENLPFVQKVEGNHR